MTRLPHRDHALDGLRGMAATAVIFYHAILHNDTSLVERVLYRPLQELSGVRDILSKIALIVFNGGISVYIFFALSGCVLQLSLSRHEHSRDIDVTWKFALSRCARIYPPMLFCMAVYYAMQYLGTSGFPHFSVAQAVQNAALWNCWPHGPSTTVQSELLAIPFILLAFIVRNRFGYVALLMLLCFSLVAVQLSALVFNLPNMHGYLFAFLAGMAVAEPALKPLFSRPVAGSWWPVLAGLLLTRAFVPIDALPSLIAMGLMSALLVGCVHHGNVEPMSRFLNRPAMQFLGKISYSLYLINVPVLYELWAFEDRYGWPHDHALETGLLTGIVALLLTIPLAWVSYEYVEMPAMRISRQIWRGSTLSFRQAKGAVSSSSG